MPKAVIFDLLTALLDSWAIWDVAADNDPERGREWRSRYLELTFGCGKYRPYEDLVQEAAQQVGLPDTAFDALLSKWDELEPWPEVPDVLRRLKSLGYRTGVVTNCSAKLGLRALARCGTADCIDAFVSAEQAGFYKPHPKTYAHVLENLGVEPRDALFVAGSNGDVVGAANAGMDVVWHNRVGLKALPGSAPLHEGKSLRIVLHDLLASQPQGLQRCEIPTPSLFLNRGIFEENCKRMHERAAALDAKFRVHIKTHKTLQGTELEVQGSDGRIACSTLKEIEHVEPLIRRGIVCSVLYGIPPVKSHLPRLASLRRRLGTELVLIIDHPAQIDLLDGFTYDSVPWPIFISIDCGDCREGIRLESERLQSLIQHALRSNMVYIYGFYTHAGHSYSVASQAEAEAHLRNEIEHVLAAANLCRKLSSVPESDLHLTLSVGATPTAHAAPITIDESQRDPNITLELHAGNFAILDLQQTSTTLAPLSHIASWVEGEVLSVYPERRELLINLGALGLGREPGREAGVWGLAKLVTGRKEEYSWNVVRLSQEHGILEPRFPGAGVDAVEVGTRVRILPQHACIAGAMHEAYFVVEDEEGGCVDEWARCRGW